MTELIPLVGGRSDTDLCAGPSSVAASAWTLLLSLVQWEDPNLGSTGCWRHQFLSSVRRCVPLGALSLSTERCCGVRGGAAGGVETGRENMEKQLLACVRVVGSCSPGSLHGSAASEGSSLYLWLSSLVWSINWLTRFCECSMH